jgi:prolyl oligopeptidase PreP (S9A serine peptidase family)
LYFASNKRTRHIEIFRRSYPLDKSGDIELVYTPPLNSHVGLAFTSENERYLFLEQSYSNLKQDLVVYDTVARVPFYISKGIGPGRRWSPIGFLWGSNTTLLVKTDFESDFNRLALLALGSSFTMEPKFIKIPYFESIPHEVVQVQRLEKTNMFYVSFNIEGITKLVRIHFNPNGEMVGEHKLTLPIPNANLVGTSTRSYANTLAISNNGMFFSVTVTNSVTPATMYMVNAKTLEYRLVYAPQYPKMINSMKFVASSAQSYKSWDRLEVPFLIYKPNTSKPRNGYPTIVVLHGGPESQAKPDFSPIRQFLLQSGFAVVEPNIRGSSGYGRKHQNMDNREKRMDAIKDITSLCAHLKTIQFVDTKNLIVMGGSYGGYASLLSITRFPKIFRAGVALVGMSNLVTFLKNTATWRRSLREPEYGYLRTQRHMLESISPIHYVTQLRSPVYIIQGANDPRVPVSEARQMAKKIKQVGNKYPRVAKSKLLILEDEGHGFSKRTSRMLVYHSLIKWINKVLQRDEYL